MGFFVAQVGWGQSDHHLRAYFLIFTALTTLVGVFPNVYNQEEAMDRNIEKYNAIVQLQDDVFHYSQTALFLYGDSIGVHALIDTINSVESRLGGIQFKVNKVNSGESLEDKLKTPGR